jgi:hypothetical protein
MPTLCHNGPECKFLKAPKGCKFLHRSVNTLPSWLQGKSDTEIMFAIESAMFPLIYGGLEYAQIQGVVDLPDLLVTASNLTTEFLKVFSVSQLLYLLTNYDELGRKMSDILDGMYRQVPKS